LRTRPWAVDVTNRNGALVYELANRCNKGILPRFNYAAGSSDPRPRRAAMTAI